VGIRPIDAPGFIIAQLMGAAAATLLFRWFAPTLPKNAEAVMLSHKGNNHG
jgi:glycerol uptake facilitator-like aquaporin